MVNLLCCGNVRYRGQTYLLATVEESERNAMLEALRRVLPSEEKFHLQFSRSARWSHAKDVVQILLENPIEARRLQWGVKASGFLRWVFQAADVRPLDTTGTDEPGRPLEIDVRARYVEDFALETTLAIGSRTWTETTSDDAMWDEPPDSADLPWMETRAFLADAPGAPTRAVLRADDAKAVTWGAVAQCLDLVLGAGIRQVDVPDMGVRLTLAEPDDLSRDPYLVEDDPVITPSIVLLSLALAVLAFAATYGGVAHAGASRRRRRSERTAARTKANPPA